MKTVILAGGMGTRLSEETDVRPKPMVEIGRKPILWHIMKIYSYYGYNDFVICLGYKGYMIKEYFVNYFTHMSDITVDLSSGTCEVHSSKSEPWRVTLVDTGQDTMTGGRVKRVRDYIGNETFMLTYGDGVGNVKISDLVGFHRRHGKLATVTAVQPLGRFGTLNVTDDSLVARFIEKPPGDGAWINGGFFVLQPEVFEYIDDDSTIWERKPLEQLALHGQLCAYRHTDFWKPMDTIRDKRELEDMYLSGQAPWEIWR